jgi:hypothetical protein
MGSLVAQVALVAVIFGLMYVTRIGEIYHGSSPKTEPAAWQAMVRAGGTDISKWRAILDGVELVRFDDHPGPIVVRNDLRLWLTNDRVWQLNWIAELWPNVHSKRPLDWQQQLDLALEGMQRLWFTIGMLPRAFTSFGFPLDRADILYPWLDRYAYWLPELDKFSSHLVDAEKYTGLWPMKGCKSLAIIASIAYFCGLVPDSLAPSCDEIPQGTLTSTLLSYNAIEPYQGRFRAVRK